MSAQFTDFIIMMAFKKLYISRELIGVQANHCLHLLAATIALYQVLPTKLFNDSTRKLHKKFFAAIVVAF